jgi:hypothetical protein
MKMLGKVANHHFLCKCCLAKSMRPAVKRSVKRREARAWRRESDI